MHWTKRYICFHGKHHSWELGPRRLRPSFPPCPFRAWFSPRLKVRRGPSGPNDDRQYSRHPRVSRLLDGMEGTHALMARGLWGTGLCLMACLRMRVKDVDLIRREITIGEGRGNEFPEIAPATAIPG